MGFLSFLFGGGRRNEKIMEAMNNGAVIIDVRTKGEFAAGHIKGAKNIPLDGIKSKVNKIKKLNKPVITCCKSGARSGMAASLLKQNDIAVLNGGGWASLNQLVNA